MAVIASALEVTAIPLEVIAIPLAMIAIRTDVTASALEITASAAAITAVEMRVIGWLSGLVVEGVVEREGSSVAEGNAGGVKATARDLDTTFGIAAEP
jgi:hypothetical protein